MAIKYYKEDFNKSEGTLAIKLPMNGSLSESNTKIFNMSRTTEEQAISNYVNLLLTAKGERFMQPRFGVGLWREVFEQMDPTFSKVLETEIERQASVWLPYIINDSIVVDTLPEENTANIRIEFRVTEAGANRVINLFTGETFRLEIE